MPSITRIVVGGAVVGAVGVGALALIAGPHRLSALWGQTTDSINQQIDKHITDPVALRAQLASLAEQYPRRIASVRSDLGEVRSQLAALARERQIAERVSTIAQQDLNVIRNLVARAEEARVVNASLESPKAIEITFQDKALSVEQAYARAADIHNTRTAYTQRVVDIERDSTYLQQQEQRLAGLLSKLEQERSDFQVQMWQLDRQVDSISRNDRMIAILSKTQDVISDQSRYKAVSVDQVASRIGDIRARQEGELAALASAEARTDYEGRAKAALTTDTVRQGLNAESPKPRATIRIKAQPGDEKAPPVGMPGGLPGEIQPGDEPARRETVSTPPASGTALSPTPIAVNDSTRGKGR